MRGDGGGAGTIEGEKKLQKGTREEWQRSPKTHPCEEKTPKNTDNGEKIPLHRGRHSCNSDQKQRMRKSGGSEGSYNGSSIFLSRGEIGKNGTLGKKARHTPAKENWN